VASLSSWPGQATTEVREPPQHSAQQRHKGGHGRLLGMLALIISGFIVLFLGIGLGNAARKRFDHWAHGY
jgi:hypothetical protein